MKPLFKLTLHPVVSAVSTLSAALLCLFIAAAANNLSGAPALHVKAHKKQNPGSVIFANRLPPLVLAAEPIALPTGLDPSLVVPKQITESGNFALFIHREFVEKRTDRPLTETTPVSPVVGWRLRTAPSRAWQELRRPTEAYDYITGIDGGIIGYNYHYAACASVEKINERGQVAGLLPTNVGNILYSEHPSSEVFPHPVLWPWSVSQPQRLPVGNLTLTRRSESVPSRGHREFYPARLGNVHLDPSGRVWLGFTETRSDQFAFGGGDGMVRGGTLQTGPLPTSPMIYLDRHLRAISSDGRMQAWHAGNNSHFAAQGWGDYIPPPAGPVASAFAPATLPMAGTVLSNDGRYPAPEAGWGQFSLTTPPVLDPDRRLKVLAFNSKGDVLAQAPAASPGANAPLPELWSWRGLPTGSGQPLDGSYQQRRLTFVAPPGWRIVSIVPSLTRDHTLLGTIQQQSDFVGTTRRPALFKPVSFGLEVDANRDGQIAPGETSTATAPFRFWSNVDDDMGPAEGDDIPGRPLNKADYNNAVVDSVRDLVDFFPVYLDIKQLLTVLPHTTAGITYKLKQADGALNFVYTNQTKTQAFDYQKKILTTGFSSTFMQAAGAATTQQITAAGVDLAEFGPAFLDGIKNNDRGVILVEGRVVTTAPLRLVVEKGGVEIAEVALSVTIDPVENFYRRISLRHVPTTYDGFSTLPFEFWPDAQFSGPPSAWPDSATNGKYFVFLHGYNVDAQMARGWQAEVFKRLHVLGSKARFVGVTWHGATGLDYHRAVFHAFQTGDALAGALSFTGNADVTIAAHSLGNMVVSHAIQAGGLNPARYFMINAATPIEAYAVGDVGPNEAANMTELAWRNYDTRLFMANWHTLFSEADNRSALTWKELFANVLPKAYNFYSEEEDVVADADRNTSASILATLLNQGFDVSTGAWKAQELVKGVDWRKTSLAAAVMDRGQGGWGFNNAWDVWNNPYYPEMGKRHRYPSETADLFYFSNDLKVQPFFGPFLEADLCALSWLLASDKAGEKKVRYDLLARAIPAMSNAVAANFMTSLGNRNYPMHTTGKAASNGAFPTPDNKWRHSDFKAVALPYVYPMYEQMISRGALK